MSVAMVALTCSGRSGQAPTTAAKSASSFALLSSWLSSRDALAEMSWCDDVTEASCGFLNHRPQVRVLPGAMHQSAAHPRHRAPQGRLPAFPPSWMYDIRQPATPSLNYTIPITLEQTTIGRYEQ